MLPLIREQITSGIHDLSTSKERSDAITEAAWQSTPVQSTSALAVLVELLILVLRTEQGQALWELVSVRLAQGEVSDD